MHAFGIEPGDEVIVPSATWWSSVMPILHFGGIPVFAELEGDCLGLDPEDVERRITDRTKAIVVVHLFGMPSKMDELIEPRQALRPQDPRGRQPCARAPSTRDDRSAP